MIIQCEMCCMSGVLLARGCAITREVHNVVPGVSVQTLLQALLVQIVADKAGGPAQHEQAVQAAHLDVLIRLLGREGAALAQEIHKCDSNCAIHIENEVRLLGGRDLLNLHGVGEQVRPREMLLDILLDDGDAHVGILERLDTMANAHDQLVLAAHVSHKVLRRLATIICNSELAGSTIKRASEPIANGQQAGAERRHEVLAGARSHDGIVGARHGRAVVGRDHQAHLDELAGIRRQSALEPEQADDAANANVVLEDVCDWHAGVAQLLAAVVRDRADKVGGLADQAQLLGPLEVDGDARRRRLGLRHDDACRDQRLVRRLDHIAQRVEAGRDDGARRAQRRVLRHGGLALGVGAGAGVAKLHLGGEHAGARADAPGHERLGDAARLERRADLVLLDATKLAKKDGHLYARVILEAQEMVHERRARIAVASDGHTLVHAVGVARHDVVELVAHATGARDVRHAAGAVEARGNDVVDGPAGVADLEAARLDAADGRGADDVLAQTARVVIQFAREVLGDALCDDCDDLDLVKLQGVHRRLVRAAQRGEVDKHIHLGVLAHGLGHLLIDRNHDLLGAPVEALLVVAAEGVDHSRDRRRHAVAAEVEVEHALDGLRMHAVEERAGVGREPRGRGGLRRRGGRGGRAGRDGGRGVVGNLRAACRPPGHGRGGRRVGRLRDDVLHVAGVVQRRRGDVLQAERHADDGGHVGLGPVHVDGHPQRRADVAHDVEALLVVRAAAAHVDGDLVALDDVLELLDGAHDALERRGHVGEVGNAAADDKDLAARVLVLGHEGQHRLRVLVSLLLARRARVLAVVGQLGGTAQIADGIAVDHGCAAAGDHGPDAALDVEDRQLERCAALGVQLRDVRLLLDHVTAKRRRECEVAPLLAAQVLRRLVQLRGQVQHVHLLPDDNEGVDLEVREVQLHKQRVHVEDKLADNALALIGHVDEQDALDRLLAQRLQDLDVQSNRLGIDVADIDTALVVEEHCVALALRVDAQVVLVALLMRDKRLEHKVVERAFGGANR
eukprot:m.224315 g.224315  ORF g.224315 m.224315 type:complete len:1021 (+) comp11078_c0_seq1:64-3126(+)